MSDGLHTGRTESSAPWRLEMFGGLRLWHAGQLVEKFPTRKTAGVLAYLACHPHKAISRDTLADLFWAENDPESARNSLRVALNALRKLLASDNDREYLHSDRLTVRLEANAFSTDLADFEAALREEARALTTADKIIALRRAVSLYRGPFLSGWYEEWVDTEQNRLGEVQGNVLRRLTSQLLENRDYDEALEYAQQAVMADPLREDSHRLIIRLHMTMGNPAAAMQQYRELERILRKELGAIPSGATRELLKQIPPATQPAADIKTSSEASLSRNMSTTTKTSLPPGNGLPTTLTQFFGRENEIAHLVSRLRPSEEGFNYRLLTLTGMGGTGKSRLAIETGRQLQDSFGGNVWFSSLVGATTLTQVIAGVANGLRLTPIPETPPTEQIVQLLSGKRHLLILDNFEQAIESSAGWIKVLLERLPLLTCLITSRFRLGITGEQEVPLAPLPSPNAAEVDSSPLERLSNFASVALFVDRARAARSDFRLTNQNATAVATLCTALDGLPLAIELVAAWTRLLTPAEMQNRLHERFDFLVSSQAEVPERHRSLRAVLDESYNLISEEEKHFFARLSIFQGGWNLDAAEAVSGETNALERLNLLQQRSLVLSLDWQGQYRFRMLETVREYAASCLQETERKQYQEFHAQYYRKLVQEVTPFLNTGSAERYLLILDVEHENIRVALEFLTSEARDSAMGIQLAGDLWRFWYARGHIEEGIHWMELALQSETTETPLQDRITLREGLGRLATSMGRNASAARYLRQALEMTLQDAPHRITPIAMNLGLAAQASSDSETAKFAFEIVAEQKSIQGDKWGEAAALTEVGKAERLLGDEPGMRDSLLKARRLRECVGDTWGASEIDQLLKADHTNLFSSSGIGPVFLTLGEIAAEQGDHAIAIPLLEDALVAFRETNDQSGLAITLERVGLSTIACGDRDKAVRVLEEALTLRLEGIGRESVGYTRHLLEVASNLKSLPTLRLSV